MEARAFRSQDARQLLENPLFVEAFSSVEKHLQMAAMTCDSDDAQKALRIVISQQLLAAVKREITRVVQDGDRKVPNARIGKEEEIRHFPAIGYRQAPAI